MSKSPTRPSPLNLPSNSLGGGVTILSIGKWLATDPGRENASLSPRLLSGPIAFNRSAAKEFGCAKDSAGTGHSDVRTAPLIAIYGVSYSSSADFRLSTVEQ